MLRSLALGLACAPALAQHLERPDHRPADPASPLPRTPAMIAPIPGVPEALGSIQANIDAAGMNIAGDAANEPSICIDPTAPNRIAIGWRQFDTITSNFRQGGFSSSIDGGRTWRPIDRLTPGDFRSDPVLRSAGDGTFYYYSLGPNNFACDLFTSTDRGQTWSGPIPAAGGDKAWFVIDRTGLASDGHIYVNWSAGFGPFPNTTFTRSTDAGVSFMTPVVIPLAPQWGQNAVGPDGTLYIVGSPGSTGCEFVRASNAKDPGQTPTFEFQTIFPLGGTTVSFTGPNPQGLCGQTNLAVNPLNGHIYVLGTANPAGTDPANVYFARSTDKGNTWSAPVKVNDTPDGANSWQWMATMSVAPSGRIDAVWIDTAASGLVNMGELRYSSSSDGGITWAPSQAMSPAWNSFLGWPQQNKIGDYFDMESDLVGAHLIWAATFNGEQDVYYLRIGDYDCDGNGTGDAADIAAGAPDCDGDGILDSCEIAAGAEPDLNGNTVPDSCDCPADCEGDGDHDVFDFLCFQGLFAAQHPYADCEADGDWDVFDFLCFQARYAIGCP